MDGQPTGRHFSLIIYDDVVVQESVSTPEQIAKTTTPMGAIIKPWVYTQSKISVRRYKIFIR